jgi:hypothetical protein
LRREIFLKIYYWQTAVAAVLQELVDATTLELPALSTHQLPVTAFNLAETQYFKLSVDVVNRVLLFGLAALIFAAKVL